MSRPNSARQRGPSSHKQLPLVHHLRPKQRQSAAMLPRMSHVRPSACRFCELGHDVDGIIAIGGQVYTEITSIGGSVITLATSGAGVVTTFAGSVYTVATSAAGTAVTGSGYAPKAADFPKTNYIL